MVDFDFNESCTGCGVCSNTCPVNAIEMQADSFGFFYPQIDSSICIQCNKCISVCPHYKHTNQIKIDEQPSWLYASEDESAKMRSSSGGAFYELARKTIEGGGYVCGCVWNDKLEAEHIICNSIFDIQRMQGSKYVQSDMKECYSQTIDLLKRGNEVLFSGTPCQCTAIHNLVQCEVPDLRNKIYIVGLICHGTSTPSVWESYKKWLGKKYGSELKAVNFRDKSVKGYRKSYCKYVFESGMITYLPTFFPSSKYIEATLVYNLALRNSCNNCECKGITCACDVILGDWYKVYSGKGSLGTSCICAYTLQGKELVETRLCGLQTINYRKIVTDNKLILDSVQKSDRRNQFLEKMNDDIWDSVEEYFPAKYKLKKTLIQIGIYDVIKRIIR